MTPTLCTPMTDHTAIPDVGSDPARLITAAMPPADAMRIVIVGISRLISQTVGPKSTCVEIDEGEVFRFCDWLVRSESEVTKCKTVHALNNQILSVKQKEVKKPEPTRISVQLAKNKHELIMLRKFAADFLSGLRGCLRAHAAHINEPFCNADIKFERFKQVFDGDCPLNAYVNGIEFIDEKLLLSFYFIKTIDIGILKSMDGLKLPKYGIGTVNLSVDWIQEKTAKYINTHYICHSADNHDSVQRKTIVYIHILGNECFLSFALVDTCNGAREDFSIFRKSVNSYRRPTQCDTARRSLSEIVEQMDSASKIHPDVMLSEIHTYVRKLMMRWI